MTGGDGFEQQLLYSAELVKNSLQAGMWELMLYTYERGEKTLYYQGWFTFPTGHYKRLFEHNTGLSYWKHFYYLEHRSTADGLAVKMDDLRTVRGKPKPVVSTMRVNASSPLASRRAVAA